MWVGSTYRQHRKLDSEAFSTYHYRESGRAYGISIRLLSLQERMLDLKVVVVKDNYSNLATSLRFNLSLPRIIPETSKVIKLVQSCKMTAVEAMFKSGEATPSDVVCDGTSLLHVKRPCVCSRLF